MSCELITPWLPVAETHTQEEGYFPSITVTLTYNQSLPLPQSPQLFHSLPRPFFSCLSFSFLSFFFFLSFKSLLSKFKQSLKVKRSRKFHGRGCLERVGLTGVSRSASTKGSRSSCFTVFLQRPVALTQSVWNEIKPLLIIFNIIE